MANIHQMYGEECELHRHTEEARAYLLDVLVDIKNGKIELAQLEFPIAGGIRIIPLSELPPVAGETAKPEADGDHRHEVPPNDLVGDFGGEGIRQPEAE